MTNNFCLALLITTFFIAGCHRGSPVSALNGEWELRTELNRKTGASTNYLPGNGTIIKFTGTDYEFYSHEKFIKCGKYSIQPCAAHSKKGAAERVIYDNGSCPGPVNSFVKIDSTQISTYPDTCSNLSVIYKKIKS
ncbi:hypothetical protein SAMN06265348_11248 [Pedobacter westerhofensis]|uniref:Lipocalin-like domain-containing protein n=1 Tax=Pedobacter westerhofensis TaxID=425512 RepID=A0A521FHU1_9SPHI|nr:hypothetical protein [Pedobacter westerhofensis]SMO95231.1 hypothetical protein SAMN06265348_11248 [Pedobacter westerhofensis]